MRLVDADPGPGLHNPVTETVIQKMLTQVQSSEGNSARIFETSVVEVSEVGDASDEDWMSAPGAQGASTEGRRYQVRVAFVTCSLTTWYKIVSQLSNCIQSWRTSCFLHFIDLPPQGLYLRLASWYDGFGRTPTSRRRSGDAVFCSVAESRSQFKGFQVRVVRVDELSRSWSSIPASSCWAKALPGRSAAKKVIYWIPPSEARQNNSALTVCK